jgi:chaperonin GroES
MRRQARRGDRSSVSAYPARLAFSTDRWEGAGEARAVRDTFSGARWPEKFPFIFNELAIVTKSAKFFEPRILTSIVPFLSDFLPSGRGPLCWGSMTILVLQMEECMRFRPLHDRVVVTRIDAEEKTAGGIIIPDTAKEKPQQGEVIAVGPGGRDETGKLIPIDLKVGDHVLFGKWSGTEVKLEGVEYLIMKESDIMGVLEERAAKKKAA